MTVSVLLPVPTTPGQFGVLTLVSTLDKDREFVVAQDNDSAIQIYVAANISQRVPLTNQGSESDPPNADGGIVTIRGPGTFRVTGSWNYVSIRRASGTTAVICYVSSVEPPSGTGPAVNLQTLTVG